MHPVDSNRAILIDVLNKHSGDALNQATVISAVANWYLAFKDWEKADRFDVACREHRMVIRQSPEEQRVPNGVVNGLGMRSRDEPVTAPGTIYKDYSSNMGLSGIAARMNPKSFHAVRQPHDTGTYVESRGKYYLGLHDLSGSLFNPDKPTITEQCRWKDDGKGGKLNDWYMVLIPLAKQEDVALLHLMKALARPFKSGGEFVSALARISKRMTRITYAQESDMGAGFVSIGHKGEGANMLPRFRYGAGDVQSELVDGKTLTHHVKDASLHRANKAKDYAALLRLQTAANNPSNEVIVRVRERAGRRFPIIAQFSKQANGFLCRPGEPASAYIEGGLIPDNWASTRQR